jgi:hypothetical protein
VLYLPILVKNVATEPADSISFAVIGDFGLPGDQAADVSALVASWAVDFVVTVGDNRYGGATYDSAVGQYYCDFLSDVAQDPYCAGGNSPVNAFFPAVGNHEYSDSAGINEYLSYFVLPGDNVGTLNTSGSERYYDVIQGPVHLFFLDSEAARNGYDRAGQQEWLQTSLADTSAHWKLVILHHAPYSSAEHGSQTYMQWPYGEWGASLVLAGHDHSYERLTVDSLPYFVNGLGGNPGIYEFGEPTPGSQLRYNGDWGAQRITANEDWLTVQFITRAGILVDSLTLVH